MYRSGQRVVTQAIQKYLGSSYDVVKTVYDNLTLLLGLQNLADNADKVVDVADNLDDVTSVADNLTDVSAVADNIVAITEVNDKVDDFNTKYLGSYASAPTVDGNGDPLVEGATYWGTTLNAMFVYTGSQWVKPAGTGIVDVDTFTGDGSTASFPLDVSPASKTNTSVFIDGVYQEKDTYSVSTNLITFNTAPNDEASIEVIVNEITNFIAGTQTETHTLTSGQTVVNLTNSPAFASFHIQGEDVDSQRLDLGTDYTLDLLTNTITLTNSYPENTVLKMLYGYDDDISVELAPLNQAILDHVNDTENAHPASAIQTESGRNVEDDLKLQTEATFSSVDNLVSGAGLRGLISWDDFASKYSDIDTQVVTVKTTSFEDGTGLGGAEYRIITKTKADADDVNYWTSGSKYGNHAFLLNSGSHVAILMVSESENIRSVGYVVGNDASPCIWSLVSLGVKKIKLPKTIITMNKTTLTADYAGVEFEGVGSGYAFSAQTTIRPLSGSVTHLFKSEVGVGGVDNIKFKNMKFEGMGTCDYAVEQLSGAAWEFENIQADGFVEYTLRSVQGLNRYKHIYMNSNGQTGGIAAYSDYVIDDVEITGGTYPLRLMAGGGRVDNAFINGGTETCIILEPLDTSTNHINTALSNIYTGEVNNASSRAILAIVGNAVRRVQQVQISNLHTVSANTAIANKVNGHIYAEKVDGLAISSWDALGVGGFETATNFDDYGLYAVDAKDVTLGACVLENLCRNPIKLDQASQINVSSGVRFVDWGGSQATGVQADAILALDADSDVSIATGVTFKNDRVSATRAGSSPSGRRWLIGAVNNKMAGRSSDTMFDFTADYAPWSANHFPSGSDSPARLSFGRNVTKFGEASSGAGGGVIKLTTLPNISDDQSYIVTMQQKGTGANATVGNVFANGSNIGVVTTGNTQSGTLSNTFQLSGQDLEVNIGTGYGVTTWIWQIKRIL